MFRQSPRSRGQRSNKGFKVRHALQLILLLGVGIWLLYQTQRSYKKEKSLGEGAKVSERLRFGRKDLPDLEETSNGVLKRTYEGDDVKLGRNEILGRGDPDGRSEEEAVNVAESERKQGKEKGGGVESNGGEKRDEEGNKKESEAKGEEENKGKENGEIDRVENKAGDKKEEVKEGENEGKKNKENEKKQGVEEKAGKERREGQEKGAVKDAKIENSGSSNGQVHDGIDKDDKATTGEQNKENDSSWRVEANALDNHNETMKSSNKKSNAKSESIASEQAAADGSDSKSTETLDSSEDKQANMTAFSDETFTSHSQNETLDNLSSKTEKGEIGADFYQSDSNADPTLKPGDSNSVEGGDSTTFSDTNGNEEEANGFENPGSSLSGTNEKIVSNQPDQAYSSNNSYSQEQNEEKEEPSEFESLKNSDSQGQKEESSNPKDNVNKEEHEQVQSLNKESKGQKEDTNVEHHEEGDSSVSQDVKGRTDLDTLPGSGNESHSKDAIAK